jgi:hypothetical protein
VIAAQTTQHAGGKGSDPPEQTSIRPRRERVYRVPDARTIWLFREELTKAGAIQLLFDRFASVGQVP